MTKDEKKVIIIGASYAGIHALKFLLKSSSTKLDIAVISPSESAYFNAAAPRLLVEPEQIDKAIFSVKNTVEKSSNNTIHTTKFIKATVTKVDLDEQKVYFGDSELGYDYLIIASGARAKSPVYKLGNTTDHTHTVKALKEVASEIKNAESVAVIGGGSTGVETAAEIAYAYRDKTVFLYTGAASPLPNFPQSSISGAVKKLGNLKVKIVNNERVNVENNTTVKLQDGTTRNYGLVIQASGVIPNTEYLPASVLDKAGFVETDANLRLKDHANVIAFGDVVALGTSSIVDLVFNQEPIFQKTVEYEVFDNKKTQLKPYVRPTSLTTFVPVGKDGGVGLFFGYCVPSFLVRFFKSKDFMISKAGEHFT
ncbi:ptaL Oxidoreductase ptaL [Candida maltosa Xu316]|uniref:Putative oxidoreductase n=1 Tax=Candida maltosa (strain Xu316) TaxID=1245528 RepID=M3JE16_CANMX|nr:putative oxidoreductase [Candida maltosa Xu316]